ncbi:MAG: GTPase HflX [Desulfohalobiaceae bacterium]
MPKVRGNTAGLKPGQLKALNHLYRRRFPHQGGYTRAQAMELASFSAETGRQVGVLIDRQDRPFLVLVGEPGRIVIPDLGRLRQSSGRLRGLRLLHTHLGSEGLSQEDLMDMVFLRLDSVTSLSVDKTGSPRKVQWAHIMPPNPENRPYQVSRLMDWDRLDVDFTAQVEALEEELGRQTRVVDLEAEEDRALLISVGTEPKVVQERSLEELSALARTAGVEVAGTLTQRVNRVNPVTILGKGKLAELEVLALQAGASLLIFDRELTPGQMRNLAEVTERRVLDRTQLILDIFAQHATSRAGRLQVEMAQLRYTLPRLVGRNRALSRLAGGIGGRGPGETKLELDRRRIRDSITRIKSELEEVRRQREATRARRAGAGLPVVALVGYTNAGKSSLLNALTKSSVVAEDKLFATLDPTSRRLRFPEERECILTDTVGFIRRLPKELEQAFLATLEELDVADVLIHVADASHPDLELQVGSVEEILARMELDEVPRILALNKWDLVDRESRTMLRNSYPQGVPVSALSRSSLTPLVTAILQHLPASMAE